MKSIFPVLVIAICIGLYFMYISPTVLEVKELSATKAQYDNALAKSKELKDKRDAVLIEYNNISQDDVSKLNKIIPETFDGVLFANDINAIAVRYGLVVSDLNVNNQNTENRDMVIAATNDPYKTSLVTMRLRGQYGQFVQFLRELETSLRLIDVTGLSIRDLTGQTSSNTALEYSLEVKTYSLR